MRSDVRRFKCGSRRFEKEVDRGRKKYVVSINTPPKELMDEHVIVTGRDGGWLYAALSEREKEGALRAPFLHLDLQWYGLNIASRVTEAVVVLRVVALQMVASSREE